MPRELLSVILPVHNERMTLDKVIYLWDRELQKISDCDYHFLLCEDGSTDGTSELITELMQRYPILALQAKMRLGYGAALIQGIQQAKSKYILCIDSDGQCAPDNFAEFWLQRKKADFIMGWRELRADPLLRRFVSKLFFILHRFLFKSSIHDPSCPYVLGESQNFIMLKPYLAFLKEGFWWGFVGACVKLNKTIHEIKIQHKPRIAGSTKVYHFHKLPRIGLKNIIGLIKLKFARNLNGQDVFDKYQ